MGESELEFETKSANSEKLEWESLNLQQLELESLKVGHFGKLTLELKSESANSAKQDPILIQPLTKNQFTAQLSTTFKSKR